MSVRNPGSAVVPGMPPSLHGFQAWTYDPDVSSQGTVLPTAGTLYLAKVRLPNSAPVSNVCMYVSAAGASLTAGQCFAGLYSAAGALIASSADISALLLAAGSFTYPLVGAPYSLAAGDYYVAIVFNGTTGPTIVRASGVSGLFNNMNLSSPNMRYATANTGVTIALPPNLTAQTVLNVALWAALS